MKMRWIRVATVFHRGHLSSHGRLDWRRCPWRLDWVGISDWCQPEQFLCAERLIAAVEKRLALAGLRLVALASRRFDWSLPPPLPPDYSELWAEVDRLHCPHERAVRVNRQRQGWPADVCTPE